MTIDEIVEDFRDRFLEGLAPKDIESFQLQTSRVIELENWLRQTIAEAERNGMQKMSDCIISAIDNKLHNGVCNPMFLPVLEDVSKAVKEIICDKLKELEG